MAERKVLNKYIPPDFDPAKLPRRKAARSETDQQKVRTMLPMSVRCNTCGNYMAKGSKFNVRMELVKNENYLGMKIFRFYYKCKNCAAEFCMKTDPKSADYIVEAGATRNFEAGKAASRAIDEAQRRKEEEEKGDAMKALENRTLSSKRELEMFNALDEMKTLRSRHEKVDLETALRRVREGGDRAGDGMTLEERLDEEDEVQVQMMLLEQQRTRRVRSDTESSSSSDEDHGSDHEEQGAGRFDDKSTREVRVAKQRKQTLAKRIKVVAAKHAAINEDEGGKGDETQADDVDDDRDKGAGDLFGAYGSDSDE